MRPAEKNHSRGTHGRARQRSVRAVIAGTLTPLLMGGTASAHEGDYYPDETIPEKARSIIEDTTSGGSTTLIYAGIGGLVAVGFAVYLSNLGRNRSTHTRTEGTTEGADGHSADITGGDSSDVGSAD